MVREELLDANPGRPGAPISIPGLPIETASGGIKAPQYFVPGVAGDHGEPIAQYIAVGGYLVPNNSPPTRTATATPTRISTWPGRWAAWHRRRRLQCAGGQSRAEPGGDVRLAPATQALPHAHRRLSRCDLTVGLAPRTFEKGVAGSGSQLRQWLDEELGAPAAVQVERAARLRSRQA
jgi:hypothetical protein